MKYKSTFFECKKCGKPCMFLSKKKVFDEFCRSCLDIRKQADQYEILENVLNMERTLITGPEQLEKIFGPLK